MPLHLDLETRSQLDLKRVGLYRYATHPSTEVWCACWVHEYEHELLGEVAEEHSWIFGEPAPEDLIALLKDENELVYCHNAAFESALLHYVLHWQMKWPNPDLSRFRCTAAMAAAMSLPRDLERAAIAVGLPEQKDMAGRRLILQMAKPREIAPDGKVVWWWDADKVAAGKAYCMQDVRTERALSKRVRPLSVKEQALWEVDNRINRRGVCIDLDSVDRAQKTVDRELDRLNVEIKELTGGAVNTVNQVSAIKDWLQAQGLTIPSLNKTDVAEALSSEYLWEADVWDLDPEDQALLDLLGELPPIRQTERRVLEIRQEAAKSSTKKLKRFRERSESFRSHHRCRENFMYHGAGPGRWTGLGLQLQNFPRGVLRLKMKDIEDAIEHIGDLDYLSAMYGPPLTVVSDSLRSFIVAPKGTDLICADYSNIEGRGTAWLAGEERKLQIFREQDAGGVGVYERTAAGIYRIPHEKVDKEQRQIGKVSELACGYQGGVGAFQSMAKVYGVRVPDDQADEIKQAWRDQHPNIVNYWYAIERAAIEAVERPGLYFSVGPETRKVTFLCQGKVLWLRLPSARVLAYPSPSVRQVMTPWGVKKDAVVFYGIDAKTKQWCLQKTYGGMLLQNCIEGICRDLLADAMVRLEAHGYPVILHAHDEACAEIPEDFGSLDEFCALMTELPDWAAGLPVVAAGWRGKRYRKG